ncbi:UNVERIFIED_CONTAM: hypothetical protein FKN15_004630 [Acipenser sinensis]
MFCLNNQQTNPEKPGSRLCEGQATSWKAEDHYTVPPHCGERYADCGVVQANRWSGGSVMIWGGISFNTACTRRLALPPLRSPASRARSFSTLAPQWWNDLPTDVRTAQSLTTFRRLLKTHLFRQHL